MNRMIFIHAIQEFRIEGALDLAPHQVFDLFGKPSRLSTTGSPGPRLHQVPRADVRRHDDDGVLEVDCVAEAVGQLAVFKTCSRM